MSTQDIRTIIERENPSLLAQFDVIVGQAKRYSLIRDSDIDHEILREAPDGSYSVLKGDDLDQALEGFEI